MLEAFTILGPAGTVFESHAHGLAKGLILDNDVWTN